ncbi:MAG TPA: hypothetical protein VK391_07020 [Allosphingosinicella sp.]|nr:hypothetical protein [Allosphingosinicella sp.]
MTSGGDARILLSPENGLNRYFSAPRPSRTLAYASSTANDISAAAFAHVEAKLEELAPSGELSAQDYARQLELMRGRIRRAYEVPADVAIVFAPSGTDLEYVALACTAGRAARGTHNILLGADEVGSGCIYSAYGQYFAESTALGVPTKAGDPVPGLGETHVEMIDIPVRDSSGHARPSPVIRAALGEAIGHAIADGRHPLIHVVHGSKTGLILPSLADLDRLRREHGAGISFVVDACQARITSSAIADYLKRDAILFITGSKFMGAPPFSGFALVPPRLAKSARPLPAGFATIFGQGEWPSEWPGAETLPAIANPGLMLRLEAALFELERFQALALEDVTRVILAFHQAVRSEIVDPTEARRVAPYPPGEKETAETHPIEMRTLSMLDLSRLGGGSWSFEDAQRLHKDLLEHGIRLGQPVKCVKLADGRCGATLRIGLTMWQVVERAGLAGRQLQSSFDADMGRIAAALEEIARPPLQ